MKNFKEKIKEVLIRKNISIKELAQQLNVTPSAVSQIIAGENPQLNWLHKVSKILNVDITELILDRMKKSKTNDAFLASMNVGTAGME
jgi:transcription termination factor Rho